MSGPLRAAALDGKRVNLAHPTLIAFARKTWGLSRRQLQAGTAGALEGNEPKLGLDQHALTVEKLAKLKGCSVAEARHAIETELAAAVIPVGHVSVEEFAARAEVRMEEVLLACDAELGAAVQPSGRLDLGHRAALEFMARHPFAEGDDGEPVVPLIGGEGFLAPACVGDQIDFEHSVTRAFCARCRGSLEGVT